MARKKAEPIVDEITNEPIAELNDNNDMPAPEAFAAAIAMQTHQHLSATPEDAPAEQLNLLPRPPFDHRAALVQLSEKEQEVAELARHMESTQAAYKRAKDDWTEGSKALASLIRDLTKQMRDSEKAPEPHQLNLTGEGCAWEQEHPGEICFICAEQRAALRKEPVEEPTAEVETATA